MRKCWKCKRMRDEKYLNKNGQCRARAVCKNMRNRRRRGL